MAVPQHSDVAELLAASESEQRARGYFHTLHEILQQPSTWRETARQNCAEVPRLRNLVEQARALVLTGSGSSFYVGECVAPFLRKRLGRTVRAVGGGDIVLFGGATLPTARPVLMVSIARSGESPESAGAVSVLLDSEPEINHLVITSNRESRLAKQFSGDARVSAVTLADATCDRSLVMTSSFTNLALAACGLAGDASYAASIERLAEAAERLLANDIGTLAHAANGAFRRAVYLGSGPNFGAAREGALKMLEMTAGRVATMAETFLGLRHGPMSYIDAETLVVCFVSTDPTVQAYELDLIRELNRKGLGLTKIIAGGKVPPNTARAGDLILEDPSLDNVDDGYAALRNVIVAQLLGFFRCRAEGLHPDSPSEDGVISRVVESFTLHGTVRRE